MTNDLCLRPDAIAEAVSTLHTPARASAAALSGPAPPLRPMLAERARTGRLLKRLSDTRRFHVLRTDKGAG